VPLKVLVDKFSHTRFEPSGFTGNPQIPIAKSITDYIFRWLALKFLPREDMLEAVKPGSSEPISDLRNGAQVKTLPAGAPAQSARETFLNQQDAPPCHTCGAIMVRNGACYRCSNCGSTSGCS
jgi:ribonucleoside-diphosphate reductase alpha chain